MIQDTIVRVVLIPRNPEGVDNFTSTVALTVRSFDEDAKAFMAANEAPVKDPTGPMAAAEDRIARVLQSFGDDLRALHKGVADDVPDMADKYTWTEDVLHLEIDKAFEMLVCGERDSLTLPLDPSELDCFTHNPPWCGFRWCKMARTSSCEKIASDRWRLPASLNVPSFPDDPVGPATWTDLSKLDCDGVVDVVSSSNWPMPSPKWQSLPGGHGVEPSEYQDEVK